MDIKPSLYCKRVLLFPNKVTQLYLVLIIILYLFGPLEWPTQNKIFFYLFLFIAQFLLYYGFRNAVDYLYGRPSISIVSIDEKPVLKYLKIVIAINLLFVFLNMLRSTGMSSFSWDILLKKLYLGITHPGQQYNDKFSLTIYGSSLLTYITIILSPFLWPVLPLSLLYFNKLNVINKILLLLTVFFECVRWIAIGTNKGIIDIILIIASVLIIKHLQSKYFICATVQKKTIKSAILSIIIYTLIIALLFLGILYFTKSIRSRIDNNLIVISNAIGNVPINLNSPLMKITPDFLKPTIIFASSYLTQGYYGLSLAIGEPFVPMFGVGNSVFLMESIRKLFNIDLFHYTYQARMAHLGWNSLGNWHSLYVWIANDVHFIGVLLIMFFLGKYFGALCYYSIAKKDPIASVILCLMFMLFFYLPCNNQIFSNPPTFMAFWGLTVFWFFSRWFVKNNIGNQ
jgi:hypothetical protein